MRHLSLTLLGSFQTHLDGQRVDHFRSNKVRALLAYLAVEADRPHHRAQLAGLFWPEWPEAKALSYLRHAIHNLHMRLGDHNSPSPFVQTTRSTLQFNRSTNYWLDVELFSQQCRFDKTLEPHSLQPQTIEQLRQTVALYRAPFLTGLFLEGCAEFEQWVLLTRERLQHKALVLLDTLVTYYDYEENYEQAYQFAWRRLELEPTLEEAHRQVMRFLALSGQRSAALVQYEACRSVLREELAVEPAAETTALYWQIRNDAFIKPVVHHRVMKDKIPLPAPLPLQTQLKNLPAQLMPLIGRQKELAELVGNLNHPECRLVTLLGPGGIGKTRLAVAAASAVLNHFPQGVYFVNLAGISSAVAIPGAIVDVLKLAFYQTADVQQQLFDYLRAKTILLILDNYEHLLPDVSFIQALLSAAPLVNLLVTSRERLNLSLEWLLTLQGLEVPDEQSAEANHSCSPAIHVETFSAVNLFMKCAQRVCPGFSLTALDQVAVVRICRLVEGIPLGIELAAGWLRILSCPQIAQGIATNLDFLTTSLQDIPERQRSMKAVFEHSWRLLTNCEQTIIKRLAVFRDGFRSNAAVVITGATLPMLLSLTDKSLLQASGNDRFQMHELLRQFVLAKLAESPEEYKDAHDCYSKYYLKLLQDQFSFAGENISQEDYASILAELANSAAAWQWAVEQNSVEMIGQSVFSLWNYSTPRGFHDFYRLLAMAVMMLRRQLGEASAADNVTRQGSLTRYLVRVLVALGMVGNRLGRREQEEQAVRECQALLVYLPKEATYEQAWIQALFGWHQLFHGNKQQAFVFGQAALSLFGEQVGFFERGQSHLLLGWAAYAAGDYAQAEHFFTRNLLEWGQAIHAGKIWALPALATLARAQGAYERAVALTKECYAIQDQYNDRVGCAYSLCTLGHIRRSQAIYEEARLYYTASLALAEEFHLQTVLEMCHYGLGWIHYELAEYNKAKGCFERSLLLMQQQNNQATTGMAATLQSLATIAYTQGYYGEADHHFQQAQQIALQSGAIPLLLDILVGQALLLSKQPMPLRAVEILTMVNAHPATKYATKVKVAALLTELEAALPLSVYRATLQRGEQMHLEDIVTGVRR